MAQSRDAVADMISRLKQQRDALALQIHLGKQDAKDEWEKVQSRLDNLMHEYEPLKDAVGESASKVFDSMKNVAGELLDSIDRIRNSLS